MFTRSCIICRLPAEALTSKECLSSSLACRTAAYFEAADGELNNQLVGWPMGVKDIPTLPGSDGTGTPGMNSIRANLNAPHKHKI
jgi:hypothetical protein